MLVYLIDAFNLVHKVESLVDSFAPHKDLISYLKINKLCGSRNNKVIVVFDGYPPRDFVEREFDTVFSFDKTADDVIKAKVDEAANKKQIVVVTNDRQIRDYVKRQGAVVCKTDEFTKKKSKRKRIQESKDISYSIQEEITEELRDIWLKE